MTLLDLPVRRAAAVALALLAAGPAFAQSGAAGREAFVERLLGRMTLEEKLGQLNQPGTAWSPTGPWAPPGGEADVRAGRVGSFLGFHGAGPTRRMQRVAVEHTRLGIPLLFAADVIHGFKTIFPIPLGEAAAWDTALVRRAAEIAAREASAAGVHWTFAPMLDVGRDPRWGRVSEGPGEDPFVGEALAVAHVRGFQGRDLTSDSTVAATAKHFVAYGAAQAGRDYHVADVSERALREVYLPPFEAAVRAGARSVMAAFNEIAGVPMHAHVGLVKGTLKRDWGFDGVVVSDYTGVLELMPHGIAATRAEAGRRALAGGVDVDMVSQIYVGDTGPLVSDGRIPLAEVDDAVRRVLRLKYDLGLFADPYRRSDSLRVASRTLRPSDRAVARRLAGRSLVLLKNDGGVLPMRKTLRRLAVVGSLADDARSTIGNWAGEGRAEDAVSILAGIRRAVPGTEVRHAAGASPASADTVGYAAALAAARWAEAVVVVVGEVESQSAEAASRAHIDLPGAQAALVDRVLALGRPTAVVLMNGRALDLSRLDTTASALLEAWFPGTEGGNAVADVLFGDVNPSGKLPVTFPRTLGQVPIHYDHRNTGRPPSATEKYTSKYLDVPWTPLYPFGHGLSYTTFAYDGLAVSRARIGPSDTLSVRVTVRNTGARAGEEVVQLYLRDDVASVTQPVRRLRGFRRVALAPGEARTVTFTLGPADLRLYDVDLRPVVEPGTFTVFVGGSSEASLSAPFEVVGGR